VLFHLKVVCPMRSSISWLSIGPVIAVICTFLMMPGCSTSHDVIEQTPRARAPIAEDAYVRIGGIEQWITIHGDDRTNPIVLVVHGGPGNPMSPIAESLFESWERDFTIVQWDQRGAGRTYSRNDPSVVAPTMSVERMAQDGVEVAEFLTEHLGQPKVTIFATSWGSVLGVHMAHARPDLFHAYIGHSQLVEWDANLSATYQRLLERANATHDQTSVATLTELGPPPWSRIANWPRFRRVYSPYQRAATTAPAAPVALSTEYASEQEQAQYSEAEDFSFEHLWGLTLTGPLTQVDLPALGTTFEIPVFFVQGEQDLWTAPQLARSYFDAIQAPEKQFYLVEGAGHELSQSGMNQIYEILEQRVRPRSRATR
jgi:pimeloyl-ACP methyl ester carboxylesterase